jgi:hypothetical protein
VRSGRMVHVIAAAVAVALALIGCDGQSSDERTSDRQLNAAEANGPAPERPPKCARPEVLGTGDIRGHATGATLWALPFEPLPFVAGHEVKIVWRMTGSGPPRFTVTGPNGEDPDALQWGPEEHLDSTWNRPGDEWGTGFRFTDPGCWRITVRRDQGDGSIRVRVVDRP